MSIPLNQLLALVGNLDDSPGQDVPRERFRGFLRETVREAAQIRDYVGECLRTSGDQYNRALQDLVNRIGSFLGFEVEFGRYQGVRGELGFDGYWRSPTDFHVVVEVKTTEVYAIKTSTLVGYVDGLVSAKRIPSWEQTLGLYVVGRPDPELRQLENAIVAERRTHQLRIASVESLLSLAEMMTQYDVEHEDILAVIRPSGVAIDPIAGLMARLLASPEPQQMEEEKEQEPEEEVEEKVGYWLTPVKPDKEQTAEEVIESLVGRERIYAYGERTPGRKKLKPGDWLCFYVTGGKGVVGHARVRTAPEKKKHPAVRHPDRYPWTFGLDNTRLYLDSPVVVDADLRKQLDAFEGKDPSGFWSWFVQGTQSVTEHDFRLLTRQQS